MSQDQESASSYCLIVILIKLNISYIILPKVFSQPSKSLNLCVPATSMGTGV